MNWMKSCQIMGLLFVFILGWFIQQKVIFNCDVSWLLEASHRLLKGGSYFKDFFENNPPWVLYFYAIPVVFASYFHVKMHMVFQVYVFVWAFISLTICWFLLLKIFIASDVIVAKILIALLAFAFLILPVTEFGQREHLMVLLIFPYLLLVTARLDGEKINSTLAIWVGLMAGSGFLFKPYFLPTFMLIELYSVINRKKITALFRPETISIFLLGISYATVIWFKHQDYLMQIVPFALRWCGLSAHNSWGEVIFTYLVFYSLFAILFFLLSLSNKRYTIFKNILLLSLVGFLISYFFQQTNCYYHQFPAIITSLVIFTLLLCNTISAKHHKIPAGLFLLFILLLLQFYSYFQSYIQLILFYPETIVLFCLVPLCIAWSVMLAYQPSVLPISEPEILLAKRNLQKRQLFHRIHRNINLEKAESAGKSCFFARTLCLAAKKIPYKLNQLFYLGLTFLIVAPIIYSLIYYYSLGTMKKNEETKLVDFINKHAPNQGVYFFTTEINYVFPVMMNSKAYSASRFSFFWGLGGMIKQSFLPMDEAQKQQLRIDKNFFINMIVEDVQQNKPKLIFVETSHKMNNLYFIDQTSQFSRMPKYRYIPFNYIDYFSSNEKFNAIWQSYHYMTTLSTVRRSRDKSLIPLPEYMFDVYQKG